MQFCNRCYGTGKLNKPENLTITNTVEYQDYINEDMKCKICDSKGLQLSRKIDIYFDYINNKLNVDPRDKPTQEWCWLNKYILEQIFEIYLFKQIKTSIIQEISHSIRSAFPDEVFEFGCDDKVCIFNDFY